MFFAQKKIPPCPVQPKKLASVCLHVLLPKKLASVLSAWSSGLRRTTQDRVRKGVGSNPTADNFFPRLIFFWGMGNRWILFCFPPGTLWEEEDKFFSGVALGSWYFTHYFAIFLITPQKEK